MTFFLAASLLAALAIPCDGTILPQTALASCNPGRSLIDYNGHSGVGAMVSGVFRIRANIYEYDPYVASAGNVSAWTMLHGVTNSRYAQVGWWKDAGGRAVFVQYRRDDDTGVTRLFAAKTIGSTHNYEVDYVASSGPFYFLVDGLTIWTSVTVAWVPNEFEVHGETHNWDDQMPGGYNSRELFSTVQYQNSSTWTSVTTAPSASSIIYGAAYLQAGWYQVRDTACRV